MRNSTGDLLLTGFKQGNGFVSPEFEEARACLFGLKNALNAGFSKVVLRVIA